METVEYKTDAENILTENVKLAMKEQLKVMQQQQMMQPLSCPLPSPSAAPDKFCFGFSADTVTDIKFLGNSYSVLFTNGDILNYSSLSEEYLAKSFQEVRQWIDSQKFQVSQEAYVNNLANV